MAHKTLINGTAYDVTGGKTLINGTGYSIKKGRTLVGGTGYTISLAEQLPTLEQLFSDMTYAAIGGRDNRITGSIRLTANAAYETTYVFFAYNSTLWIYRFQYSTKALTLINKVGSDTGKVGWNNPYLRGETSSGSQISANGGTIAQVRFPSYTANIVDQVLGRIAFKYSAGRNAANLRSAVHLSTREFTGGDYCVAFVSTGMCVVKTATYRTALFREGNAYIVLDDDYYNVCTDASEVTTHHAAFITSFS